MLCNVWWRWGGVNFWGFFLVFYELGDEIEAVPDAVQDVSILKT